VNISSKVMEMKFMLFAFPLKADIENIPENLQLVLLICSVILIRTRGSVDRMARFLCLLV
jgi:hypothetical protein